MYTRDLIVDAGHSRICAISSNLNPSYTFNTTASRCSGDSRPRAASTASVTSTGAILGDLNTKRARIENQDSLPGDLAVIQGRAPLAEMVRYAAQLGSITQGQGSYTMEFSHYDVVPGNVQQQIVSKAKLAEEEEEE